MVLQKMSRTLLILFIAVSYSLYSQKDTTAESINEAETDTVRSVNGILPVFSTTTSDISGNNLQSQDVTSLLGSTRDVFMQSVSLHFITARFRYRGYNMDN